MFQGVHGGQGKCVSWIENSDFRGVYRGHTNLSESEDENYKQGENSIPER